MRVMVTGATGFIGSAVCARLYAEGHAVVAIVRSENAPAIAAADRTVAVDLSAATRAQDWRPHLAGVDAVVNCAGVLQDSPRESTTGSMSKGSARCLPPARRPAFAASSIFRRSESTGAPFRIFREPSSPETRR